MTIARDIILLQDAALAKNSQISAHREKVKTWIKDQGELWAGL